MSPRFIPSKTRLAAHRAPRRGNVRILDMSLENRTCQRGPWSVLQRSFRLDLSFVARARVLIVSARLFVGGLACLSMGAISEQLRSLARASESLPLSAPKPSSTFRLSRLRHPFVAPGQSPLEQVTPTVLAATRQLPLYAPHDSYNQRFGQPQPSRSAPLRAPPHHLHQERPVDH